MTGGTKKKLSLIHFNDVYNCDKSPKFVHQIKASRAAIEARENECVYTIFAGDAFSPSITSTIVRGKQMIPILNELSIDCSCLGNHDLDFGLNEFEMLKEQCNFPFLCSNANLTSTKEPLGDCVEYVVLDKPDHPKVLVIGLIEADWIDTLATIDPSEIEFEDFVTYCKRRIPQLVEQEGPFDYVVASTHMRMPNDYRLAEECGDLIDIVLGGHDHHYEDVIKGNNVRILNSGTDFADFTIVTIEGREGTDDPYDISKPIKTAAERVTITPDIPDDPNTAEAIKEVQALVDASMDVVVGSTKVDLDSRFTEIRTKETNISNFVATLMNRATGADIAILNSGTLRADRIMEKGALTVRDLCNLLPMPDEMCVVELTAERLLLALENGVCKYPAKEGRFPCVDGVRFEFDPNLPPGQRVIEGSVYVRERPKDNKASSHSILRQVSQVSDTSVEEKEDDDKKSPMDRNEGAVDEQDDSAHDGDAHQKFVPLDPNGKYKVVSKAYLVLGGKDGYDKAFLGAPILMDEELCPVLPNILRNVFTEIMVLKRWAGLLSSQSSVIKAATKLKMAGLKKRQSVVDPYAIRPMVDGRITNILEKEGEHKE